jgi:hypothetical protein|tara:strand:+ start:138 stop:383 length:246 start_codon:yes stop_codon:yes gene_type:complete
VACHITINGRLPGPPVGGKGEALISLSLISQARLGPKTMSRCFIGMVHESEITTTFTTINSSKKGTNQTKQSRAKQNRKNY